MLPTPSTRMVKAKTQHLVLQGLFLHYASFWGPLRASKTFRETNPNWLHIILTRWIQEYGLNFSIFLVGQFGLLWSFKDLPTYLVLTTVLLLILPVLTVIQMVVDNFRTDSQVYYDPFSKTGLTVKTYQNQTGDTVWIFYNHFALPIGARKGQPIRKTMHEQAAVNQVMLGCYAQNKTIANYYLQEFAKGIASSHKRPFILWNYSGHVWQERAKSSWIASLFGFHSARNSGQIPLG